MELNYKYKKLWQIAAAYETCSSWEDTPLDLEIGRNELLETMHGLVGYRHGRPYNIDEWFEATFGIKANIEWLTEPWQFGRVLRKLIDTTPEEVKTRVERTLGFFTA